MTKLNGRHLLGIEHLEPTEIDLVLDTAESLAEISRREIKKVPTLRGRTVVNFFVEPSTRTLSSFELAEKRLSADSLNFSASRSSFVKGETLLDTARNLEAMAPDFIVIRHGQAGAPHFLADHCRSFDHQRRRRRARASHTGAPRRLHDPPAKGAPRRAPGRHRRRHPPQPRRALQRPPAHADGRNGHGVRPADVAPEGGPGHGVRGDPPHRRSGGGRRRGDDAAHPARAHALGVLSLAEGVCATSTASTRDASRGRSRTPSSCTPVP